MPVFQCAATCTTAPLDLGSAADVAVLTLYGTGLGTTPAVTVKLGGASLAPDYAGPQGPYPGLDQINVRLPAALQGSGVVLLTLGQNGVASNAVKIEIR